MVNLKLDESSGPPTSAETVYLTDNKTQPIKPNHQQKHTRERKLCDFHGIHFTWTSPDLTVITVTPP